MSDTNDRDEQDRAGEGGRSLPPQNLPPQNEAGLDRAGTGHGGRPNATDAGRADAAEPRTERPGDQEGPTAADGSQEPPDPRVGTVPLDTDDGAHHKDGTDGRDGAGR